MGCHGKTLLFVFTSKLTFSSKFWFCLFFWLRAISCFIFGYNYIVFKESLLFKQLQKQPSRGVLKKRCSKIYSKFTGEHPCRSAISIKFLTSARAFSCKFAAYFQNTFSQEHLWVAAFAALKFEYDAFEKL